MDGWTVPNSIGSEWTFFSNYAHVLVCLAQNPRALLREIADRVGVTERTAMRLINQLDQAGILKRKRQGRRNFYEIKTGQHLRHPLEAHCTIDELLSMILRTGSESIVRQPKEEDLMTGDTGRKESPHTQQPRETRK